MKKLISIPIFLLSLIVTGTDYYVKNTGNDSNSGLDDANAWAHHPWMITWTGSTILKPGDNVFLKRGDSWSMEAPIGVFITVGQSGSAGNPIKTTWYGVSGNKPLIQIAGNYDYPIIKGTGKSYITFDHLEIKHHSSIPESNSSKNGIVFGKDGNNNIPHDWIITNCDIHNIPVHGIRGFDDSYNILIGDISATICATKDSYSNHIYDCGYSGIFLCGRDPVSGHSHWDVSYNYIHDINYTGVGENSYGITFTATANSNGWPVYCSAKFNRVEDNPKWEGIECHGGSFMYFQDNYVFNCRTGIAGFTAVKEGYPTAFLDHCYIERNTIENPKENTYGSRVFIYLLADVPYFSTNSCIKNNTCFYSSPPSSEDDAYGIYIYGSDGAIIEGNRIYSGPADITGIAIRIGGNDANPIKNIIVHNNWISAWSSGLYVPADALDDDVIIHNNIICSQKEPFSMGGGISLGDFSVYNNTFIVSNNVTSLGAVSFSGEFTISTGASVSFKNNIVGFFQPNLTGIYLRRPNVINGTFDCDYNLYWNSTNSEPYFISGDGYHKLADWKEHGYDAHSIYNMDPAFKNSSGIYSQDLDFNLQSTSPAVNKGTDVGLIADYAGNPISGLPDIGAFENQPVIIPSPTFTGSIVENAAPSVVELTYNLTLANIVPSPSAFTVMVNSSVRSVNSVSVSGTKVLLTLTSPVTYNNLITIAYTKPSTNPLQTTAGGQAASMSAQTVTNKVAAPTVPVYVSSAIENAAPSKLEMTYNLSLANIVPAASAFTVKVNSVVRTVSSISISGTKVSLTLASQVAYGNVVTIAYTKPSTNPLQTTAGGQAASMSAQTVTNKVAAPAVPVYVSSAIENAAPSKLEMTYNLSLANIVPAASVFTVKVNSVVRTINSISISGTKVFLNLASPVAFGNVVTVAYTKPESNPLQSTAGGQAETITPQTVTNRVAVINVAPVVVVSSPKSSYSGFVNEINASGSYDPNKDNLTFTWSAPASVPLSSSSGAIIRFLGPMVDELTNLEITLNVSDGKTSQKKTIPIEIVPYKPELEAAEVMSVESSSFYSLNYPHNVIDGNIGTIWSANGIDQWLIIELKELFSVQHVNMAFQPGQKRESYFDVLGSDDKITWESILTKSASCDFSGDLQVFAFPPSKTGKEFKYVKLAGLGNSTDTWNYISELKIYGYRHPNPSFYENLAVKIYPNPASNIINIRIDEPTLSLDFIRIINLVGYIVYQDIISPDIKEIKIPLNLENGIYLVQLGSGKLTQFAQKLIVSSR